MQCELSHKVYALSEPDERRRRYEHLRESHIAPLTDYVEGLRKTSGYDQKIPTSTLMMEESTLNCCSCLKRLDQRLFFLDLSPVIIQIRLHEI